MSSAAPTLIRTSWSEICHWRKSSGLKSSARSVTAPRLLILDEPTAALTEPEWLFGELERLAAAGTTILYITHRLAEVRRLCARATILRNGENIGTVRVDAVSDGEIFAAMVGVAHMQPTADERATKDATPDVALRVRDLAAAGGTPISLDVNRGEIVGVAALEGQGQRELFRRLGGAASIDSGTIEVEGRIVHATSPARALRAGIAFLPEERKTEGVFLVSKSPLTFRCRSSVGCSALA